MGVINHNAVIATTWDMKEIARIELWYKGLEIDHENFFMKSPITPFGIQTIVLFPDGSKEGWKGSYFGDQLREKFIEELLKGSDPNGGSAWNWIEVGYGEYGQKVLRGNNGNCYDSEEYFSGF